VIPKTSTGKIQKFLLRNQVDSAKGDFGLAHRRPGLEPEPITTGRQ